MAYPGISVLVLATVLGVWLLLFGFGEMYMAFRLRSAARSLNAAPGGPADAVPAPRDAAERAAHADIPNVAGDA